MKLEYRGEKIACAKMLKVDNFDKRTKVRLDILSKGTLIKHLIFGLIACNYRVIIITFIIGELLRYNDARKTIFMLFNSFFKFFFQFSDIRLFMFHIYVSFLCFKFMFHVYVSCFMFIFMFLSIDSPKNTAKLTININ